MHVKITIRRPKALRVEAKSSVEEITDESGPFARVTVNVQLGCELDNRTIRARLETVAETFLYANVSRPVQGPATRGCSWRRGHCGVQLLCLLPRNGVKG